MTIKCENPECGKVEKDVSGYDDDNFWQNVLPKKKCGTCTKSTEDMGAQVEPVIPKYNPWKQV